MRNSTVATLLILLFGLVFVPATMAQEISNEELNRLCPAVVDAAYAQFGANCGNVEVGDACYGNIGATAYDDITGLVSDRFLTPSNVVPLTDIEVVDSEQFDFFTEVFGITMKEIRADLPVALGQEVKIIGFNDIRLEGGVRPDEAVQLPDEALAVNAGGAEVFSVPPGYNETSEPVGVAPLSEPLFADAQSPDGAWVRVYFEHPGTIGIDASAWVQVADIVGDVDVTALPVFGPDDRTISQEIYLTNSNDLSECEQVPPNLIYVQSPEGIESTIYINDAELVITDTVLIEVVPRNNTARVLGQDNQNYVPEPTTTQNGINPNDRALLHCIVVAGFMECEEGNVLPSGFEAYLCLIESGNLGLDDDNTLDWSLDPSCGGPLDVGPVPQSRAERLQNSLTGLPQNVTERPFEIFIIVQPSGVDVEPIIRRVKINDIVEFERLCAEGVISPEICAQEGFGSN